MSQVEVLVESQTEVVTSTPDAEVLVEVQTTSEVVEDAVQGPPGPPGPAGPPGPVGDANGAFLVTNRFSEIASDETAQLQARQNLGVHYVDGGTFN